MFTSLAGRNWCADRRIRAFVLRDPTTDEKPNHAWHDSAFYLGYSYTVNVIVCSD
jgi:hypothetical protein